MSTSTIVKCPWCQATNRRDRLVERAGRCRSCHHQVQSGLDYLRAKRRERRLATTKRAKAAARRAAKRDPQQVAMRAHRQTATRVKRAEMQVARAWLGVADAVRAHIVRDVVDATRALVRADRRLTAAWRAFHKVRATVTQAQARESLASRAIVLPDEEA